MFRILSILIQMSTRFWALVEVVDVSSLTHIFSELKSLRTIDSLRVYKPWGGLRPFRAMNSKLWCSRATTCKDNKHLKDYRASHTLPSTYRATCRILPSSPWLLYRGQWDYWRLFRKKQVVHVELKRAHYITWHFPQCDGSSSVCPVTSVDGQRDSNTAVKASRLGALL